MSFDQLGLCPELLRSVADEGYSVPTSIQTRAIPVALSGRDLLGCAQTGSGKTASFLLPILQRLRPGTQGHLRALVLTPTRELAAQVAEASRSYGRHLRLRTQAVFGGVGMSPVSARLRAGVDIVVATPGRLLDHMGRGDLSYKHLEVLVLDEADRMLDMGFLPDVRRILGALPAKRQNLFFSATMPPEIEDLVRRTLHAPELIEVTRRSTTVAGVRQMVHPVSALDKRDAICHLLEHGGLGRTLIFTRTKVRADRLAKHLAVTGRKVAAIHGDKSQNQRTRALDGFRSGSIDTLVATDIAARGIDVDGISHVINFDLPHVPEDYVHRIGRTARAAATGEAISLCAPEELADLKAIERLIGKSLPREAMPGFVPGPRPAVAAGPHANPHAGRQPGSHGHAAAPHASRPRPAHPRAHARAPHSESRPVAHQRAQGQPQSQRTHAPAARDNRTVPGTRSGR